ncbi:MAG: helix-turn-helix domain-containing protein [Verrucomicrobiaceae bacterium]
MGKPRGKRHPSSRRVKLHRSYRVDEAASAVDSCRATIRRWIKDGLPTVRDTRPALILGSDLIDYLDRKRSGPKCGLAECYCFKCRSPRRPALGMADFILMSERGGNLRALCSVCGCLMHKRISVVTLTAIQDELAVQIVERQQHLEGTG